MEMEAFDRVLADNVEPGDVVENDFGSLCEVVKTEDDGDRVIITLEDGNEIYPKWDDLIWLHAYPSE